MVICCPQYFPGVIVYIHSISGKTEFIEINKKILLRNPCQIEMEKVNYHRQRRWLESVAPRRCDLTALDCVRTTHFDETHSLCRVVLAI